MNNDKHTAYVTLGHLRAHKHWWFSSVAFVAFKLVANPGPRETLFNTPLMDILRKDISQGKPG